MIDLGLTKLAVIGAVALVVIGPEKLPTVARMVGTLYGRAQRYLQQVKAEVSRELDVDALHQLQQQVQDSAGSVRAELASVRDDVARTAASVTDAAPAGNAVPMPSAAPSAAPDATAHKAREFRRKKLAHASSVPAWYKNRQGTRQRVLSGAARGRAAPTGSPRTSFF
jgi:sec-independent protein translocase protein TatB